MPHHSRAPRSGNGKVSENQKQGENGSGHLMGFHIERAPAAWRDARSCHQRMVSIFRLPSLVRLSVVAE